jgi:glutamate-1-semialdehyde aminotransferase
MDDNKADLLRVKVDDCLRVARQVLDTFKHPTFAIPSKNNTNHTLPLPYNDLFTLTEALSNQTISVFSFLSIF